MTIWSSDLCVWDMVYGPTGENASLSKVAPHLSVVVTLRI